MFAYHNPVHIVFDSTLESALSSLALKGEILLVVSASLVRCGIVERVRAYANVAQVVDSVCLGLPHELMCSFTLSLLLWHCENEAQQLLVPFCRV